MMRLTRSIVSLRRLLALVIVVAVTPIGNYSWTQIAGEDEFVRFVDDSATGNNDGRSWPNAYTDLESALDDARNPMQGVTEIWVAEGTYTPTAQTDPSDSRTKTFSLAGLAGVRIMGGFDATETVASQRNPYANESILDGNGNYHVIFGSQITGGMAMIDGFTITGGIADGVGAHSRGGGILLESAGLVLLRCRVVRNQAESGGGMSASLAMFTQPPGPSAAVYSCQFSNNTAEQGGGIYVTKVGLTLVNCVVDNNTATGSSSTDTGGGMKTDGVAFAGANLINCTFARNSADEGAGIHHAGSGSLNLINSILYFNTDTGGVQDEEAQIFHTSNAVVMADYSCIQNLTSTFGTCNFADDPKFVNSGSDFRLQCANGSPCVDTGSDGAFEEHRDPFDLDQDGDTSEAAPDADANRRIRRAFLTPPNPSCGQLVDVGAYESIERYCPADIDPQPFGNGTVNVGDLLTVINQWGSCPAIGDCIADIASAPCVFNGVVDVMDLLAVINNWGPCQETAVDELAPGYRYCLFVCETVENEDHVLQCINECLAAIPDPDEIEDHFYYCMEQYYFVHQDEMQLIECLRDPP